MKASKQILVLIASLLTLNTWAGQITGTLTADGGGGLGSSASGNPGVKIYDMSGVFLETAMADPSTGAFISSNLPTGNYFLHSFNFTGYLDEIHDGSTGLECSILPCEANITSGTTVPDTATGVSMELVAASAITGLVTDQGTSNPLAGVEVCVFQFIGPGTPAIETGKCAMSDGSGMYETAGFDSGTGLIVATRPPSTGAHVPLMTLDNSLNKGLYTLPLQTFAISEGVSVSGTMDRAVDFALPEGAELDLSVDDGTFDITDFRVFLFDFGGFPIADFLISNAGGSFRQGIPIETTFISVEPISPGPGNLTGEFVGGVPCSAFGTCGFPFAVGANSVPLSLGSTRNETVSLDSGRYISGNIKGSGTNLDQAIAEVVLADQTIAGFGQTDATGNYTTAVPLPPANNYYVKGFQPGSAFVPEYFDNVTSIGAQPTDGQAVDITTADATGIDFDLAPGAVLFGNLIDEMSNPIGDAFIQVDLYDDSTGQFLVTLDASTDPGGNYTTDIGVPTGNYNVVYRPDIFDNMGMPNYLVPIVHDDTACPGGFNCDFSSTPPLTLVGGTNQWDLTFNRGHQVVGTVQDDQLNPLDGVPMDVFDAGGNRVGGIGTMFGGSYILTVPANTGFYIGTNDGILQNELYDNVPCPGQMCESVIGMGTAINGAAQTETFPQIDFVLEPQTPGDGTISGRVTNLADGMPISGALVSIERIDGPGTLVPVGSDNADASGNYSVGGLGAGDYRVVASAPSFTAQQFGPDNNESPMQLCDTSLFCNEFATDPVTIAGAAETVDNIDIALQEAGTVTGELLDDMSMMPIDAGFAVASLVIFDDEGEYVTDAFQNSGAPFSINLPLGTYYAVGTVPDGSGYIDTALGNTDCPFATCDLLATVPINVTTPGQVIDNVDILLPLGFTITGTIDDTSMMLAKGPISLLEGARIFIYDALDQLVAEAEVVSDGSWGTRTGLRTANNYYLSTVERETGKGLSHFTGLDFIDVVYDGIFCPDGLCEITDGTIVMAGGFYPVTTEMGTRLSGTVSDDEPNPLNGITVQVFRDDGMANPERFALGMSIESGTWVSSPLPDGDYFAVTDSSERGYFDEIFDNISCLGDLCETQALSGTTITASGGVTTPTTIDFQLGAGSSLSPADLEAQDKLGAAVAVCEGRLAVGMPGDDDLAPDAGAVLIYRKEGTGFIFEEKIYAQTPEQDAMFGSSIACNGGMFVVGFPGKDDALAKGTGPDKGVAVFQLGGGSTALLQQLIMSNLGQGNQFGSAIAMDGGNMVIGAPNLNGQGAAVMFGTSSTPGLPWASQTTLIDPGGSNGDGFGMSVDVAGGSVVVGSPMGSVPGGPLGSGVAQMFTNLTGSNDWNQIGKFTNTNPGAGDQFGSAVSLDGTTIAVGAPMNDTGGVNAGAAFIFSATGGSFSQSAQLLLPGGQSGAGFGTGLSLVNGQVAIGAPGAGTSGSALLFQLTGGTWTPNPAIDPGGLSAGAGFGTVISFDGTTIVVGAPSQGVSAGAAQAFPVGDRLFYGRFE